MAQPSIPEPQPKGVVPSSIDPLSSPDSPRTEGGRPHPSPYLLRLFVAGASEKSLRAIEIVTGLCERHLPGQVRLEVVDLYRTPWMAPLHGIMVAPTLVQAHPLPPRRLIGEHAIRARLLALLSIQT